MLSLVAHARKFMAQYRSDAVFEEEPGELGAKATGQPLERIEEDADRDRWFTPLEAKEYGFIDHVITHQGDVQKGKA